MADPRGLAGSGLPGQLGLGTEGRETPLLCPAAQREVRLRAPVLPRPVPGSGLALFPFLAEQKAKPQPGG